MFRHRHVGFFVCMASLCAASGFAAGLWAMSARGVTHQETKLDKGAARAALVAQATRTAAMVPPAGLSSGAPRAPTDRAPPQSVLRVDVGTPQVSSGPAFLASEGHVTHPASVWIKNAAGKLVVHHKAKKGEKLSIITQTYPSTRGGYATRVLPLDEYIAGMQGYQDGLRSLNVQNAATFAVVLLPQKDGSSSFGLLSLKACVLEGAASPQAPSKHTPSSVRSRSPSAPGGYGFVNGAHPPGGYGSPNPLGYRGPGANGPRGSW